jgi:hypothetical protein
MKAKLTDDQIKILEETFKKKGWILKYNLKYMCYDNFFVNKQFDNKNFCVVESKGESKGVLGLFRKKKDAVEFGIALGLIQIPAPVL